MTGQKLDAADELAMEIWAEQIRHGHGDPGEVVDLARLPEWWANRTLPREDYMAAANGDVAALARVREEAGLWFGFSQ